MLATGISKISFKVPSASLYAYACNISTLYVLVVVTIQHNRASPAPRELQPANPNRSLVFRELQFLANFSPAQALVRRSPSFLTLFALPERLLQHARIEEAICDDR